MLRILISFLFFAIGIGIIYFLIKYNKKIKIELKNKKDKSIDAKYLYNVNVITFCIAIFFIMLPFILFYT